MRPAAIAFLVSISPALAGHGPTHLPEHAPVPVKLSRAFGLTLLKSCPGDLPGYGLGTDKYDLYCAINSRDVPFKRIVTDLPKVAATLGFKAVGADAKTNGWSNTDPDRIMANWTGCYVTSNVCVREWLTIDYLFRYNINRDHDVVRFVISR